MERRCACCGYRSATQSFFRREKFGILGLKKTVCAACEPGGLAKLHGSLYASGGFMLLLSAWQAVLTGDLRCCRSPIVSRDRQARSCRMSRKFEERAVRCRSAWASTKRGRPWWPRHCAALRCRIARSSLQASWPRASEPMAISTWRASWQSTCNSCRRQRGDRSWRTRSDRNGTCFNTCLKAVVESTASVVPCRAAGLAPGRRLSWRRRRTACRRSCRRSTAAG